MSRFFKPLVLPAAFFLLLSAQECAEDSIREEITVNPDAGVEVAFQKTAGSFGRLLDSDPTPSLEMGWDSVHVGTERAGSRGREFLRAWRRYTPGADLPGFYGDPDDPLSGWYVQFPTQLSVEERGDTLFFHFQRRYPALDWIPMGLFKGLPEEGEAELARLEAWEDEHLDPLVEEIEALEAAEEVDSFALRQAQEEFRNLLGSGDPSVIERYVSLAVNWSQVSLLGDIAMVVPASAQFCGGSEGTSSDLVQELARSIPEELDIPLGDLWRSILDEVDFDPDPQVFPEWTGENDLFFDEGWLEEIGVEAQARIREDISTECGLSLEDRVEFDRRLEWLNRRYGFSEGEVKNQNFSVLLSLPGEILETNADTLIDGRPEWKFKIRDLLEEDVTLQATTRLIRKGR